MYDLISLFSNYLYHLPITSNSYITLILTFVHLWGQIYDIFQTFSGRVWASKVLKSGHMERLHDHV